MIYTREQSLPFIREAFRLTRALTFTRQQHLDNLDVEVYHRLPHNSGTLAAFIDGYTQATEAALRERHLDYVFMAGGVLYNGVDEYLKNRPHSMLIPSHLHETTEVAWLWRGSDQLWTPWQRLTELLG